MAAGYSQHFTLADIFNNKKLRDKIPLINYKETTDEVGKTHRTTRLKTIGRFVFDKSVSAARPFYAPLKPRKAGNMISIGGNLIGGQDDAVEAIYGALLAAKTVMEYSVNFAPMIRTALKEGEKEKPAPKLYLKQNSMAQIEAMNKKEMRAFMQDVIQNVLYGDYPRTQKKYGVEDMAVGNHFSYEQNRARWERKVGAL